MRKSSMVLILAFVLAIALGAQVPSLVDPEQSDLTLVDIERPSLVPGGAVAKAALLGRSSDSLATIEVFSDSYGYMAIPIVAELSIENPKPEMREDGTVQLDGSTAVLQIIVYSGSNRWTVNLELEKVLE